MMFGFIIRWYNRRRRQIDLNILWPSCKRLAPNIAHARAAFAMHALHDDAWLDIGNDEIFRIIGDLS